MTERVRKRLLDALGACRIVGMRNRIIHGYDSVDDMIVWDVVQEKVPHLARVLEGLIDPM